METLAKEPALSARQRQGIYPLAQQASGSLSGITQRLTREQAQALGLSKKRLGELVHELVTVRSARFNKQPWSLARSTASFRPELRTRIAKRLSGRLRDGFAYRQPESDWIKVFNTVSVELTRKPGEPSRFFVNCEVKYHPKKNWRANETGHVLVLNPLDDFTTVGGLLTIFRKADRHAPAIACHWYEQGRGFELRQVAGYLVGSYHLEAESAARALTLATRRNKQATAARQAQAALAEGRDSAVLSAAVVQRVFGFCLPGIRSFCEANGLNLAGSYTLRELRAVVLQRRELNCRSYAPYLRKLGLTLNCA